MGRGIEPTRSVVAWRGPGPRGAGGPDRRVLLCASTSGCGRCLRPCARRGHRDLSQLERGAGRDRGRSAGLEHLHISALSADELQRPNLSVEPSSAMSRGGHHGAAGPGTVSSLLAFEAEQRTPRGPQRGLARGCAAPHRQTARKADTALESGSYLSSNRWTGRPRLEAPGGTHARITATRQQGAQPRVAAADIDVLSSVL